MVLLCVYCTLLQSRPHQPQGDLLALPRSDCIAAEQLCLLDSTCNGTYRILENCALAKTRFLPLDHDSRVQCLNAELDLGNSSLQHCKCHRRMKREEHCLREFIRISSGDFLICFWISFGFLGSQLARDATNPCVKATHVCNLSKKCVRLRTEYASICTKGAGSEDVCDRRKCHRGLRNFFEKVPEDFTKRILFCPCQDELCGERRRKTIVPNCSFQYSTKPNCLWLLDSCLEDHICKSRLADFQQNCQPADTSPDGCSQHSHAACLEAYMGMIGTPMTPNYVSNSSAEVSLWCTCENSGNEKEKCDQILGMFENSKCLGNASVSFGDPSVCLNTMKLFPDSIQMTGLQQKKTKQNTRGGQTRCIHSLLSNHISAPGFCSLASSPPPSLALTWSG
uniref:GDNF/GAS1 domain-containing protein n=1 Tax=Amazona collaria TaxID=241587 RepID=A0A8B9GBN8_9PSIT